MFFVLKNFSFYLFRVILSLTVHQRQITGGNYTMTIGERIKKIRIFCKMTMDELGGSLGFEGKNMSVHISQY